MKARLTIAFILIGISNLIVCAKTKNPALFEKLSDVEAYAATLDEYPAIDNNDWEKPDHQSLLESLVPNWTMRQLEKLGITHGPWSVLLFKRLLKIVASKRMNDGFQGRFAQKIVPSPATEFIIFGELDGAFFSFIRDLRSLVNQNKMNNSFKIIKDDCYFVIDGDAVVRGPYLLEMFTLILRLMYVNPTHVIYVIGELEDKERWQDYGLKEELKIRAAHISNEKIPLQKNVQKFFDTLPLALYLIDGKTDQTINAVRISSYQRDEKVLEEKKFAAALVDPEKNVFSIYQKGKTDIEVDIRAILRRDPLLQAQHRETRGLVQYSKEGGATSWALLSSPTGTYRTLLHFYYDSYVILTTYKLLQDWTLTLYGQDVRLMTGIRPLKVVNLLSGTELSEAKIQANIIQGLQEKLKATVNEIGDIEKQLAAISPTIGGTTLPSAAVPAPTISVPAIVPPVVSAPAPVEKKPTPEVIPAAVEKPALIKPPEIKPEVKPVIAAQPVVPELKAAAKPEIKPEAKPTPQVPAGKAVEAPSKGVVPTIAPVSAPAVTPSLPAQAKPSVPEKPTTPEKWAVPPTGDIIIGGSFDLSRNAKEQSTSYIDGLELAFGEANETGGINGRNITLQVKDDEGDPFKAYDRVQEIRHQYKTDLITGPMGASTITGILDLIKKGEILSVFPYLASPIVRRPSIKYVINYMIGTLQTFFPMFEYAFNKMGARKPAIVYTRDIGDKAIEMLMAASDIKNYVKVAVGSADVDFGDQIKLIDRENPDLIVFLTYPTSAINLMRQMKEKIHDKIIMIDASLVGEFFSRYIREKVSRFIIGAAVPDPKKIELTVPVQNEKTPLKLYIIENYKKVAQKKGSKIDSISLVGFISGKILVEILRKVQGVISKEAIIAVAESMTNVDFEGLPISFDQLRHEFAKYMFLDSSSENWIAIDVSKRPYEEKFMPPEDIAAKHEIEAKLTQKKEAGKTPEKNVQQGTPKEPPKVVPPSNGPPIRLASSMDLSDGLKDNSLLLKKSIESLFSQINKEGGINGRKVEITVRDDGYDVTKALVNVDYFLNVLKINTFIAPVGSPTLESYLGKVKMGELLILFPLSGSDIFRSPDIKYIINFRSSYNRESSALAKYAIETLHAKKIAIFYQKTAPANAGALEYFKKVNFTNYFELDYNETAVSFKEQARKIEQENPDVLMLFAIQSAALSLVQELGTFVRSFKILGWSILSGDAFEKPWRASGQEIVIASVVPNPAAETATASKYPIKLIQSFQKFAKDNSVPIDPTAFEGYIDARIALELYKQAQNNITNEKIIECAQNLKDFSLDDLLLTFNPQTRELYHTIWLDTGKGDWQSVVF